MPQATSNSRALLRKEKPDTWIAVEPGDRLIGKIADVDIAWSDVQSDARDPNSGWYPLLTIDQIEEATGYDPLPAQLRVHGFATVLRNEILRREPAPGELVQITYEGVGEAKAKGRSAPELYRVKVSGRDPAETAARVYGQLRPRGAGAPPPPSGDEPLVAELPADGSDHPF